MNCVTNKGGGNICDPSTLIWHATAPNNDLTEFNSVNSAFGANCFSTINCIVQTPTSTVPAVALSKTTIGDLSTASKTTLGFHVTMRANSQLMTNLHFGYYVTTNSTLPGTYDYGTLTSINSATAQTFSLNLRSDTNGQIESSGSVFPISSPFDVASANFNLIRVGNPSGNLFAEVYSISGVLPNGTPNTLLATSQPLPVNTLSSVSVQFVSFTFPRPLFIGTPGANYFIVVDASQLTTTSSDYVTTFLQNIVGTQNKADFTVGASWAADNIHTLDFGVSGLTTYNPYNDPSVAFLQRLSCTSNCVIGTESWTLQTLALRTTGSAGNTLAAQDAGCNGSGSTFLCNSQSIPVGPGQAPADSVAYLNYTGATGPNFSNGCTTSSGLIFGSGCSWSLLAPWVNTGVYADGFWSRSQNLPWFKLQVQQYYQGFWTEANNGIMEYSFDVGTISGPYVEGNMFISTVEQLATAPTIDTGGFFGPVIQALVNLGVFILNAILGFIAFIAPALQTALSFLETQVTNLLNLIGNALGFGNVGTDLATFLNNIVNFFTNNSYGLPAFFLNFPSYFTNFLRYLQISFPFITPAFTIANAILIFGVNGIAEGITIVTIGLQMLLFGYGTFILFAYFLYVGDDGIGGLFTFLGTLEAISFKLLNIIATIVNLGLDFIVHVISLIPKPFIQMSASRLPRLPTVEANASMTFPQLDFGEARNGNLIVYWLWCMGLWFLCWFESQNPALPGSIVALDPALATNVRLLGNFIPLMQAATLISGGLVLIWFCMLPMRLAGIDVTEAPLGASLGRRTGPGPSSIHISAGKKHLIGTAKRIEKERQAGQVKKEEEARKAIEKTKKKIEEEKRTEELRKRELERKPTGKDLRGPNLQ